ncbi:MAG: hypothetical protein ACR2OW_01050 [Methyloligellaceae bacterium]
MSLASTPDMSLAANLKRKFRADLLTNWRLVLLGLTGLVLSLASGWTTFDGMTNFTRNGFLSLLITFGIQGVMLVTAWLIGESFATGATGEGQQRKGTDSVKQIFVKAVYLCITTFVLFAVAWLLARFILQYDTSSVQQAVSENLLYLLFILGVIFAVAFFLVLFARADIVGPYAQGIRVILSHLPLWFMFLCCMATSVFFSFDSLFSSIFPEDERKRAGELRSQGQISGIVADLEALIKKRRDEEAQVLFQGEPWKAYETELVRLAEIVRQAPDAIEAQVVAKMNERQTALAAEREKLSGALSSQERLNAERAQLSATAARIAEQRPSRLNTIDQLETRIQTKQQEIAERRAAAEAEARGVGSTGQAGRGPIFRELNKFVTKLEIEIGALREQLNAVNSDLENLDRRASSANARTIEIDKQLARLKSQEISAEEGIKIQDSLNQLDSNLQFDTTGGLKVLDEQLATFRQEPNQQAFSNIQRSCGSLLQAISTVSELSQKAGSIDCEPGQANEAAGRIFAINNNLKSYEALCGKQAAIPSEIDAILNFGQKCVQTSGLVGADTQNFRLQLNRMALNRDDKAHRFVVTWNSFADGNRLAYLALAIAIAIDGLVFMSGLFGANAIVSPLADSPRARNRPISQLEEIVDNALLPNRAYAAELVLNVMQPILDDDDSGYVARVDLNGLAVDQHLTIRKVLTAGAVLGLIKQDENASHHYLVRPELFEYLSMVNAREAKLGNKEDATPKYQGTPAGQITDRTSDQGQPLKLETTRTELKKIAKPQQVMALTYSQPTSSDPEKASDEILQSYLHALDLKNSTLLNIENLNLGENQEEWQYRLDGIREQGGRISYDVQNIRASIEESLQKTTARLIAQRQNDEAYSAKVREHSETFGKWLPGIVIFKAYEKSKRRAEQALAVFRQLDDLVQDADDDLRRDIERLVNELGEAELEKIDGWQDLENLSTELESKLNQLSRNQVLN